MRWRARPVLVLRRGWSSSRGASGLGPRVPGAVEYLDGPSGVHGRRVRPLWIVDEVVLPLLGGGAAGGVELGVATGSGRCSRLSRLGCCRLAGSRVCSVRRRPGFVAPVPSSSASAWWRKFSCHVLLPVPANAVGAVLSSALWCAVADGAGEERVGVDAVVFSGVHRSGAGVRSQHGAGDGCPVVRSGVRTGWRG